MIIFQNLSEKDKIKAKDLNAFGAITEILEEEQSLVNESKKYNAFDGDMVIPETDLSKFMNLFNYLSHHIHISM